MLLTPFCLNCPRLRETHSFSSFQRGVLVVWNVGVTQGMVEAVVGLSKLLDQLNLLLQHVVDGKCGGAVRRHG